MLLFRPPFSSFSRIFLHKKSIEKLKISSMYASSEHISERLCIFFPLHQQPSLFLYIYFLISYHTFFSISRDFYACEEQRRIFSRARVAISLVKSTVDILILMLKTHPFSFFLSFHRAFSISHSLSSYVFLMLYIFLSSSSPLLLLLMQKRNEPPRISTTISSFFLFCERGS